MKIYLKQIAVLAGLIVSSAALAQVNSSSIDNQIHDYILKNPEVLVQSLQSYQQKQMDQARQTIAKTQQLAPKYATELFRNSSDPAVGNPNGAVTIVEFFDYQCPHCLRMHPVFDAIVKANPDVRIVYKEFPIRGPASETASRAALAARNQNKYDALHDALMKTEQLPLTDDMIFTMAKNAGLDVNKLKADMKSDAIDNQIKANMKLGQQLQLLGTPAIFIAKSDVKQDAAPTDIVFVPGQADQDQLQSIIKQVK